MNTLCYTTRALTGREGKSLSRHLAIVGKTDVLSPTPTIAKKKIEEYGNTSIGKVLNPYKNFYLNIGKQLANWMEVYDALDVSYLSDYSAIHVVGGIDLHNSRLGRQQPRAGIFPMDHGQLKFESTGIQLTNMLAILKAHNQFGIPLHEIAFDPNEMSFDLFHSSVAPKNNYHLYHGYDIPKYNAKRLDSLQAYFESIDSGLIMFEVPEKIYDFTFGYYVMNKSGRDHYPEQINQLAGRFARANVYARNEYTGENTTIDADEYLTKISQSRFTLMLPSYDKHCFSIYRFVESLRNDCLPLIHPDVNIEDVNASFGVDLAMLRMDNQYTEPDRVELLRHLQRIFLPATKKFR